MDLLPLFLSKSCQGGLVAIVSYQKVAKVDDNDDTGPVPGSESVNAFVSIKTSDTNIFLTTKQDGCSPALLEVDGIGWNGGNLGATNM